MNYNVLTLVNGWMQIIGKDPRAEFPRMHLVKIEEVTSIFQDPDSTEVILTLNNGTLQEYNFDTPLETMKFYNSVTQILLN